MSSWNCPPAFSSRSAQMSKVISGTGVETVSYACQCLSFKDLVSIQCFLLSPCLSCASLAHVCVRTGLCLLLSSVFPAEFLTSVSLIVFYACCSIANVSSSAIFAYILMPRSIFWLSHESLRCHQCFLSSALGHSPAAPA